MIELEKTVVNPSGIHARPAAVFVGTSKKYKSSISITNLKTGASCDAKSILKILTLMIGCGTRILLRAEGPDEQKAIAALSEQIDNRLGEDG